MDILQAICKVAVATKEVIDYLKQLPECSKRRQEIENKMKILDEFIEYLKTTSADVLLPSTCDNAFCKCMDSLSKCKVICKDLHNQRITGKLLHATSNVQEVEKLEKELSFVAQTLQLFCDCWLHAKVDSISEALSRVEKSVAQYHSDTNAKLHDGFEVLGKTINQSTGVYRGVSHKAKPKAPDKPNVTVQEDCMVVKWNCECPPSQQICKFEVQLNSDPIFDGTPQEFTNRDKEDCYSYAVSLRPPRIKAGPYSIIVRAIYTDEGPSEWSQFAVCEYKTEQPEKPKKPTDTVNPPPMKDITIAVELPKKDDENGYPVQKCIAVKNVDEFRIDTDSVTIPAQSDKTLPLNIRIVIGAGKSPPELLPGVPVNVRISSTRKRDSIKVRWERPEVNAEAAFMYDVEMIRSKQKQPIEWNIVKHHVKKLYARVDQLNSNTKYKFRVRALNSKGHALPDQWSDVVEAETRHGKGVALLAAAGAFIGGTLGGPVLGIVGIGSISGMAAAVKVNSTAGSTAAGVAAGVGGGIAGGIVGIIGAPLFGVGSAALAYDAVSGNLPTSPPTSEDESP